MKRMAFVLLAFSLSLSSAFADGGGGTTWGMQAASYPFLDGYDVPNNSAGLVYYGGYGYGISGSHRINGGFGYVIADPLHDTGLIGGYGGVISGFRFLKLPVNLSLVSWTGFGGVYTGALATPSNRGYFCISEELSLELGLPIQRWLMPVVYAGYQVAGNIVPGTVFQSFLSYTPVFGVRVAWGKFY